MVVNFGNLKKNPNKSTLENDNYIYKSFNQIIK